MSLRRWSTPAIVLLIHLALLVPLSRSIPPKRSPPSPRLTVRTVQPIAVVKQLTIPVPALPLPPPVPTPEPPEPAPFRPTPPPLKPVAKPTPPPPKPAPSKPAPKQTPKPDVKPAVKPHSPPEKGFKEKKLTPEQREKLRRAQETIAKIGQTIDKPTQALSLKGLKGAVPQLQIDRPKGKVGASEQLYCDELIERLRLLLSLPEFGEVKLLLTIERTGRVSRVEVVKSMSSKNREYLLEKLTSAQLPGFGSLFPGCDRETFPITLISE